MNRTPWREFLPAFVNFWTFRDTDIGTVKLKGRGMEPKKMAVKVIPAGTWPDSSAENRTYWLSRRPAERIRAAKKLRRKRWRLFHREELPRLVKVFRAFKPYQHP